MYCLFCVLFVCKCVLYCCHRVTTQLRLINISYHIILNIYYLILCIFSVICRGLVNTAKNCVKNTLFFVSQQLQNAGQFSLFSIARSYRLDFPGFERRWWAKLSAHIQAGPGIYPILQEYRKFSGRNCSQDWLLPPTLSRTEIKERVET